MSSPNPVYLSQARKQEIAELAEAVAEEHCLNGRVEPVRIATAKGITLRFGIEHASRMPDRASGASSRRPRWMSIAASQQLMAEIASARSAERRRRRRGGSLAWSPAHHNHACVSSRITARRPRFHRPAKRDRPVG